MIPSSIADLFTVAWLKEVRRLAMPFKMAMEELDVQMPTGHKYAVKPWTAHGVMPKWRSGLGMGSAVGKSCWEEGKRLVGPRLDNLLRMTAREGLTII